MTWFKPHHSLQQVPIVHHALLMFAIVGIAMVGCNDDGPTAIDVLIPASPELPSEARLLSENDAGDTPSLNCPTGSEHVSPTPGEQWCETDGAKNGPYMKWFDNGNRMAVGSYAQGKQDSQWTEWYEDGANKSTGFYQKGRKHGSWTTFWPEGNTRTKGDFLNGREVGIWTYYHQSGLRSEEGTFVNGVRDGDWRTWTDDGTPSGLETWSSGKKQP